MSKSYGNAIYLSDPPSRIEEKVDSYLTDPQRTHRRIPGNPEVCPVFAGHRIFSTSDQVAWADVGCRTAGIGCRDCKAVFRDNLVTRLEPIARRRADWESSPDTLTRVLSRGAERARAAASATMEEVRAAMRVG